MKVRIQCPHCNKVITIPTTLAGKKGRCPGCNQVFQIPTSLAASEPNPTNNVYDAEDASTELPPMPEPGGMNSDSPFGNAGTGGMESKDDLGYGLSSDLLSELDNQPAIPSPASDNPERVPCPVCKEPIVRGAAKCHHCGEIFDLVLKAHEKHKQSKNRKYSGDGDDDLNLFEILVAIFCGCIGCICAIVWMIQGKKKGLKMLGVCILAQFVWFAIRVALEAVNQVHVP